MMFIDVDATHLRILRRFWGLILGLTTATPICFHHELRPFFFSATQHFHREFSNTPCIVLSMFIKLNRSWIVVESENVRTVHQCSSHLDCLDCLDCLDSIPSIPSILSWSGWSCVYFALCARCRRWCSRQCKAALPVLRHCAMHLNVFVEVPTWQLGCFPSDHQLSQLSQRKNGISKIQRLPHVRWKHPMVSVIFPHLMLGLKNRYTSSLMALLIISWESLCLQVKKMAKLPLPHTFSHNPLGSDHTAGKHQSLTSHSPVISAHVALGWRASEVLAAVETNPGVLFYADESLRSSKDRSSGLALREQKYDAMTGWWWLEHG